MLRTEQTEPTRRPYVVHEFVPASRRRETISMMPMATSPFASRPNAASIASVAGFRGRPGPAINGQSRAMTSEALRARPRRRSRKTVMAATTSASASRVSAWRAACLTRDAGDEIPGPAVRVGKAAARPSGFGRPPRRTWSDPSRSHGRRRFDSASQNVDMGNMSRSFGSSARPGGPARRPRRGLVAGPPRADRPPARDAMDWHPSRDILGRLSVQASRAVLPPRTERRCGMPVPSARNSGRAAESSLRAGSEGRGPDPA